MAAWSVVFLFEVDEDLATLGRADATLPTRLRQEILEFAHDPFKSKRLAAVLAGHGRTTQVDRLEQSDFPQSLRLQVLQHYRATLWCLPTARQMVVVHVSSKSADPTYRRALPEHDRRLARYLMSFKHFVDRAERRTSPR